MIHDVAISSDDRTALAEWVAEKKRHGTFTVIDVGSTACTWCDADAFVDFVEPTTCTGMFFKLNLNVPETWKGLLDYVATHGKFDFSICSHTLEDISCPQNAIDLLEKISKAGYIAMPSKHREMARFEQGPHTSYRGHIHHKWIFDVEWRGDAYTLVGYPKIPATEYMDFLDAIADVAENVKNLSFNWKETIPFREVNDGYLGPTLHHIPVYFEGLL
jgi:hypothetical protein